MSNARDLRKLFQKIQVVRAPRHRLATFGSSRIDYSLVTDVPGLADRSRLRTGVVIADRPALITADALREHFPGFSSEARAYAESLVDHYGEALRGLQYQFKNEARGTRIELGAPEEFVQRLARNFDQSDGVRQAIIRGTDQMWELSLMKFIVEETLASFASNVREMQDRGFFDGEARVLKQQHREILRLFEAAQRDPGLVKTLASKLKEYDLFEQYQDRFFRLVGSR